MLNRIQLMGEVTSFPTIRFREDGREMATFFLSSIMWKSRTNPQGVDHRFSDTSQKQEEWHQITVYRNSTVKWIKNSLHKGDWVLVEGKLYYMNWKDSSGKKQKSAHIIISHREGQVLFLRRSKSSSLESPQGTEAFSTFTYTEGFSQFDNENALPAFLEVDPMPFLASSNLNEEKAETPYGSASSKDSRHSENSSQTIGETNENPPPIP